MSFPKRRRLRMGRPRGEPLLHFSRLALLSAHDAKARVNESCKSFGSLPLLLTLQYSSFQLVKETVA